MQKNKLQRIQGKLKKIKIFSFLYEIAPLGHVGGLKYNFTFIIRN